MNGVLVDYVLRDDAQPNTTENREWWFNDVRTAATETGFSTKREAFKAARRARRNFFRALAA
jgi:hypothetical protein